MDRQISSPTYFSIQVLGSLDVSWSDRLGGMAISHTKDGEEHIITTLSGPLIDQAALFGVLNALYDMRFSLLSVDILEKD